MANEINIEANNIPEEPQNNSEQRSIFLKLINNIMKLGDKIKEKINRVLKRFEGFAEEAGTLISNSLDRLRSVIAKGKDEIINTFVTISDGFAELTSRLIEQMFTFLPKTISVAAGKGYNITNIELTLPELRFEYVNMLQISIPLPNIDPPEMTLTVKAQPLNMKK